MSLFLAVYLVAYGAINFYFFWKVRQAVPMPRGQWVLAAFLVLMVVGPLLLRAIERRGWIQTAGGISVVLFSWLAVSFWFFSSGVAIDLWNLACRGLAMKWHGVAAAVAPPKVQLAAMLIVVVAAVTVSLLEAQRIGLTTLRIVAPQLPAGTKPIRVVQITDLHLGGGTGTYRLGRILDVVRSAEPDLLISTGDMLDAPLDVLRERANQLAGIQPPLGKVAIMGNHEYYVGIAESRAFHDAAGFRLLRDEAIDMGHLRLIGRDDRQGVTFGAAVGDEQSLLAGGRGDQVKIVLKHRPEIEPASAGKFDLQLSGHTHGGQIFPFSFVVWAIYHYDRGWYDLGNGSKLYVNVGAGTWGPPMRLFAPPEVVLIIIEPGAAAPQGRPTPASRG